MIQQKADVIDIKSIHHTSFMKSNLVFLVCRVCSSPGFPVIITSKTNKVFLAGPMRLNSSRFFSLFHHTEATSHIHIGKGLFVFRLNVKKKRTINCASKRHHHLIVQVSRSQSGFDFVLFLTDLKYFKTFMDQSQKIANANRTQSHS